MPNKRRLHKHRVAKLTAPLPQSRGKSASAPLGAHSVKDLLARAVPVLSQAGDQTARQAFWQKWLAAHLSAELAPRLSGAVERAGNLTLFAESAAWAARLRYALPELEAQLRRAAPHVNEVRVRVLPRQASSGQ
jgi:hypothetical protein